MRPRRIAAVFLITLALAGCERTGPEVMTRENLITVPVGTTLEEAEKILHHHRVEKLLVVDKNHVLKGLITVKDIQKKLKYPNAAKDAHGRLRVAAAIGATGDFLERAQEMVKAKVDVLAIDSAHGHSSRVLEAIKTIKPKLTEVDLIAGNRVKFKEPDALRKLLYVASEADFLDRPEALAADIWTSGHRPTERVATMPQPLPRHT